MKRDTTTGPNDGGLSLVEVIVALTLIGLVATAAATFFISGLFTTKKLQSDQVAVSVANQALDAARAVSPRPATLGAVSGVLKGRAQSDVESAFNAANPIDTADLIRANTWDPAGAVGVADDWVPLTYDTKVANTTYKVTTLIGGCYRAKESAVTEQNCTVGGSEATDVLIYRVRVIVTWKGPKCTDDSCSYRATSLIDPSADVFWNTNLRPFAADDEITVSAGQTAPTITHVMTNDYGDFLPGANPVTVRAANPAATPPHGPNKGTALSVGGGNVSYLPTDDNYSGTDSFAYSLKDARGQLSTKDGNVHVRILPTAKDDSARAATEETTTIDVFANDLGKVNGQGLDKAIIATMNPNLDVVSMDPDAALASSRAADQAALSSAGIVVDGTTVKFTPPAGAAAGSITTFYYYLADVARDDNGDVSGYFASVAPATVSVMVGDCMNIEDLDVPLYLGQAGPDGYFDFDVNGKNGNKASCRIQLRSVKWEPAGQSGQVKVGGQNWPGGVDTGTTVSFRPQEDIPFYFELTYRMVIGGSQYSDPKTLKVAIYPVANDDTYDVIAGASEFRPQNSTTGNIQANDYPSGGSQVLLLIQSPLPAGCGSFDASSFERIDGVDYLKRDGMIYKPPATRRDCSFTYVMVPRHAGLRAMTSPRIVSNPATVTFKVGPSTVHNRVTDVWAKYDPTPNIPNSLSERAANIADTDGATKWFVGLNEFSPAGSRPIEVMYRLSSAQNLTKYSIRSANDANERDPKAWTVWGSNSDSAWEDPDHSSWVQVDSRNTQTWSSRFQTRTFNVTTPGSYKYFKLRVSSMRNSTTQFQIADWILEA